jgi:polysaccharide deacetylase 2 family uncharacterized protein YibQ
LRSILRYSLLLSCGLSLTTYGDARASEAPLSPTLVIIIDDLGYHLDNGLAFVRLPVKLNLAILPHTANAQVLAQMAAAEGKEVLLHAPMSNVQNQPMGPGALTPQLGEQKFRDILSNSLASMPYARGINNHMGSELTTMRQPMEWLMDEVSKRGLYFVDSRTTGKTLAAQVATEKQVPTLSRQVFLDNIPTRDAIDRKFRSFLDLAQKNHLAVAIGHPYPETLAYLREVLPGIEALGFRIALVSEVLAHKALYTRLQQEREFTRDKPLLLGSGDYTGP